MSDLDHYNAALDEALLQFNADLDDGAHDRYNAALVDAARQFNNAITQKQKAEDANG